MKPNQPEPCSICGGSDLNLIDGYYYCVECGTQDVNAQETVVEHTMLADGTFAHAATRKITKILKDAIEMSGEWHKWHAFNFILSGMVEELMILGAPKGFQDRVLWIWTRYMNEFMDKDQMGTITEIKEKQGKVIHKSLFEFEDEIEERSLKNSKNKHYDYNDSDDSDDDQSKRKAKRHKYKKKINRDRNSIKVITKGVLLSIVYIALNLERSDIQLSDLFRFIREGKLSNFNSKKFVPQELDLKSIPHWKNFMNCNKEYAPSYIRQIAMLLIKVLDLGKLVVPDLRKLVDNYVKELCLPIHFKNLVYSLMHQVPCDHLDVDYEFAKSSFVRIPDFEGIIMSYVVVALKMTFGLDDHYEVLVSDAVEKINEEDNRLKSYKLGLYSEPTDRLFSFREWSRYLQFRKIMLCKNYTPMALQHNLDVDDRVFLEHLEEREKRKVLLGDQVTMDILDKIPTEEASVIPKSEFNATLTPMADYTNVILHYIQDPDVKLLISEDFTQYSLKYACVDLKLLIGEENIITGVSEEYKYVNRIIVGSLTSKNNDYSMVYVRDCENKNWLLTNPPTVDHIKKIQDNSSDEESDSYKHDSILESTLVETDVTHNSNEPEKLYIIEEEKEGVCIYDDLFDDIEEDKVEELEFKNIEDHNFEIEENFNTSEFENNQNDLGRSINDVVNLSEATFDPQTFQRERTIKELVLAACKKYKIPTPKEYDSREPRKRHREHVIHDVTGVSNRKRTKRGDAQKEMDKIMTAYYANLEKDLLEKVSEHFTSIVNMSNIERENEEYERINYDTTFVNYDHNLNEDEDIENKSSQNEIDFNKTVDSSVMEVVADEDKTANDLIPKVDPKFDDKTHDVNQLYVKYSQSLCFENILDNDDPEIGQLLDKKIEECKISEPVTLCAKDLNLENGEEKNDDDKDEKTFLEAISLHKEENIEPLIQNTEEICEFKYWQRQYTSQFLTKNVDRREKFDMEMRENFPKSFNFVMKECAAIIECTAFSLYKHVLNLEQMLFK